MELHGCARLELRQAERRMAQDEEDCRICFDSGGEPLIRPCPCRGSAGAVHFSCLKASRIWIWPYRFLMKGFARAFVHACHSHILDLLPTIIPPQGWWLSNQLKVSITLHRSGARILQGRRTFELVHFPSGGMSLDAIGRTLSAQYANTNTLARLLLSLERWA